MLKLAKWVRHDPFGLFFNLYDDIACLEILGGNIVFLHEDDEYDEYEEFYDDEEDDFFDELGDDFDEDDDYDDTDEDDTDDYDLDNIITNNGRWIICEDDHYNETEDIVN